MNENKDQLCTSSKSCLAMIDMQERLIAQMPGKVSTRMQRNSVSLIQASKALSIPIITTTQYTKGLGSIVAEIDALLPPETVHVEKTCFSAAASADFMNSLAACGRRQVILIGIEAHVCILQTAAELKQEQFDVFVVSDAICSRYRENYENALHRIRGTGTATVETESVLFEWLRDAEHPLFKEFLQMIK